MKKIIFLTALLFSLWKVSSSVTQKQYLNEWRTKDIEIDGEKGVEIIGYKDNEKILVIPPTIKGKKVLSIGNRALYKKQLTSVDIPDSVKTIRWEAFTDNRLTSIKIPDSVTLVGVSAFSKNKLTSVTLGNSLKTIGNSAFSKNQLKSIKIPNSVIDIGHYAFYKNQLTNVILGNSLKTIGNAAFSNNQLTSIKLSNSLTNIGIWSFSSNPLKSITIKRTNKNSLTEIHDIAFFQTPLKDKKPSTKVTITVPNGLMKKYKISWKGKIDQDAGIRWKQAP